MSERLQVRFPGGKRVDVQIREWRIPTDQQKQAGGEGYAPEPFDLFLSAMAACAGVYALNFCQARRISTEGLGLTMDWDWNPKTDARARVRYRLTLPEGFPEKYRAGIRNAMGLCSVKKHIQTPPEFSFEIEESRASAGPDAG